MTSENQPPRIGKLYVVAVPIGHPDDLTVRGIRILKTVDIIASEDPNATQQLLAHHQIHTTVTSYGPYHLKEKARVLLQRLQQGADVALVSDCGSPLIADPGHLLVALAHAHRIPVVPVPGPSAVIAALTASGVPCESFYFLGHLPNSRARITRCLTDALTREILTIAFCTVTSVAHALRTLTVIAPRRRVVLACDLTQSNERILSGTPRQISQKLRGLPGEDLTLVLAGTTRRRWALGTSTRVQSLSSRRIKTR
ncbi:MAG: rRNA small subunit methyltransferase 1 [Nitrospira sp.]|nr:rRNA small subunit methyltransferase 1 [Nitrospira sp.]MDH4370766.1 rRNA small subunit methyltransferase 1 [Nitrospira sp.]MDH5348847.1 rRNA small subunit methyltransferase 1 [Nitrospira sp.]MDH5499078.1 rRNA small subunit methyltransferase 1 [Nitrospira sp.]MDH5725527.1 rRNA small subunit methyltransferase 1 [Nitrospira sp.]